MKNLFLFSTLLLFLAMFITGACKKDNPCENIICFNGGVCDDGTCVCPPGFTGDNCEIAVDPCGNTNCLNGGTCVNGECDCPPGFTGDNCETAIDPCLSINCLNGGTCVNGECDCPPGFSGDNCEIALDPCNGIVCLNGGTCINGECDCPPGYGGPSCGTQLEPSKIRITKIRVTKFPATDNGAGWDLTSGADIYVHMEYNGNVFYEHPSSIENANPNSTHTFTPNVNLNMNNPTDDYIIRLYDYDSFDADDYIGGIQFVPYWNDNNFPNTIYLDANQGLRFELDVTYSF